MATQRVRIYEENRRLSLWFWIVPFLLLLCFVAFFFLTRRQATAHAAGAVPVASTLPDLGVVQFDPARPTLTPDGQATLDRAAEAMRGNPNVRLRLDGVRESPTSRHRPGQLTIQRLHSVAQYLDTLGIERSRVTIGSVKSPPAESASLEASFDSRRLELYAE